MRISLFLPPIKHFLKNFPPQIKYTKKTVTFGFLVYCKLSFFLFEKRENPKIFELYKTHHPAPAARDGGFLRMKNDFCKSFFILKLLLEKVKETY